MRHPLPLHRRSCCDFATKTEDAPIDCKHVRPPDHQHPTHPSLFHHPSLDVWYRASYQCTRHISIFSKNRKQYSRHIKAAKIGVSIFIVFFLSMTPAFYALHISRPINGYYRFAFAINNLSNFFIYLFVDDEFRARMKKICIRQWTGCDGERWIRDRKNLSNWWQPLN